MAVRQKANETPESSSCDARHVRSVKALVDPDHVVVVERINYHALPKKRAYHLIKRVFDVVACCGGLVILSPAMLVMAAAIKLDSPGPALYKQERLGKDGIPFYIYKFRSMRVDAERDGVRWASENDDRITRVGGFLRESHLDELPQFWNVLRGDMSLVGPRPERAVFYEEFEKYIRGFNQRMMVMPGMTGLAQVIGGYTLKPAEKILYDIEYIKKQGIMMDTMIILKTFVVLANHKGAR